MNIEERILNNEGENATHFFEFRGCIYGEVGLMKLQVLGDIYQMVKLDSEAEIPREILGQEFFTVSKTQDELSIIVSESVEIESEYKEEGWKIIKFVENMDLALIGITARIATVLADNNINMCALATYDTDYVLVSSVKLEFATQALKKAGYEFMDEETE